jgi:CheY-like chemotaxis protein
MSSSEPRMVVLVVEDETLVRMFIADFLDEAGFKVFEAVSGDEAVQVLQARPDVQVVVTDIEMPGAMNGLELARVIRERWPGVGVVLTSGRERPRDGDVPDAVAFLPKPYAPFALLRLVQEMLGEADKPLPMGSPAPPPRSTVLPSCRPRSRWTNCTPALGPQVVWHSHSPRQTNKPGARSRHSQKRIQDPVSRRVRPPFLPAFPKSMSPFRRI